MTLSVVSKIFIIFLKSLVAFSLNKPVFLVVRRTGLKYWNKLYKCWNRMQRQRNVVSRNVMLERQPVILATAGSAKEYFSRMETATPVGYFTQRILRM